MLHFVYFFIKIAEELLSYMHLPEMQIFLFRCLPSSSCLPTSLTSLPLIPSFLSFQSLQPHFLHLSGSWSWGWNPGPLVLGRHLLVSSASFFPFIYPVINFIENKQLGLKYVTWVNFQEVIKIQYFFSLANISHIFHIFHNN